MRRASEFGVESVENVWCSTIYPPLEVLSNYRVRVYLYKS